jgi:two-component system chemotaxis response regulator CheB
MAPRIRVLVVDDSAFARKVVREVLEADARFEVVGIARDGIDALEKITALAPDVVTLDLVMPNLDGVGVLRALRTLALPHAPRVVIVSMSEEDSELAVSALQLGAVDLVRKPTALATDRLFELSGELISKVVAAAAARPALAEASRPSLPLAAAPLVDIATTRRILVIGASTGGPHALTTLLGEISAKYPVPIAVVLHMPVGYTEAFARRLDQRCAIEVIEAYEGVELRPGRAVIARAGMHLHLTPGDPVRGRFEVTPLGKPHRPSVDVLFQSAAEVYGASALAVVLTGMGDDGLIGARALRAVDAPVLTEAESSCVVYGMPRSVKEAGMSTGEATLDRMARVIQKYP